MYIFYVRIKNIILGRPRMIFYIRVYRRYKNWCCRPDFSQFFREGVARQSSSCHGYHTQVEGQGQLQGGCLDPGGGGEAAQWGSSMAGGCGALPGSER